MKAQGLKVFGEGEGSGLALSIYTKPLKWWMILFTIYDLFTMTVYDGNGRKSPKYIQSENKGKNSPLGCPPIPPSTKIEADCIPVSKNKPDLP